MYGHFRSRDKDRRHNIKSVKVETPFIEANIAMCNRTGVIDDRSFNAVQGHTRSQILITVDSK